jgi:hypothetical protein
MKRALYFRITSNNEATQQIADGGIPMIIAGCLDDLIECLWKVLGSEMDRSSEFPCRAKCLECLEQLVGSDHHYTRCFRNFVEAGDDISLLIAGGILNALKEEIAKKEPETQIPVSLSCPNPGSEQDTATAAFPSLNSNLATPQENQCRKTIP